MTQELTDTQLERYSRHILIPQIDVTGQQKLLATHVLIIGAGGLGSPAAMYLASSGIGKITLCDSDEVEISNLQRQIIHHSSDIGKLKVISAKSKLNDLNPEVVIEVSGESLQGKPLIEAVRKADIVIDASDNFDTRFAVNKACVNEQKPLVSGSAISLRGQLSVFNLRQNSPCYQCLFPQATDNSEENCSDRGVISPLVGIIGSIMAVETLKIALNIGKSLDGRLLILDAETMHWRDITIRADPDCPVCAKRTA